MANSVYTSAKSTIIDTDLDAATLKLVLLNSSYTFSAAHQHLSDIVSGDRVATSSALTGLAVSGGVLGADSPTLSAVDNGTAVAYAVYIDSGTESTSKLLTFIDTESDGTTAISLATNGSDVEVDLSDGILAVS